METAPRCAVKPCSISERVIPVALLGKHARAALTAGTAWRVLAAFRRSMYCRSAEGAVVCVGHLSLGGGPLNILAPVPSGWSWPDLGVTQETRLEASPAAFRFDGRLTFHFAEARLWQPRAPAVDWDHVAFSDGLRALTAEYHRRRPLGGLAPTIPWILGGGPIGGAASGPDRSLWKAAAPGIAALSAWSGSAVGGRRVLADPPRTVEGLIGLGPGLTPSGDDLLAGALIALRALGWPQAADRLGRWLLRRARARTHAISYAHLVCAAEGEGATALHDTLAALSSPGTPGLGGCLDALSTVGHSSGWDATAGLAVVARAAATSPSPGRPDHVVPPVRSGQRCTRGSDCGERHAEEN